MEQVLAASLRLQVTFGMPFSRPLSKVSKNRQARRAERERMCISFLQKLVEEAHSEAEIKREASPQSPKPPGAQMDQSFFPA